MALSMICMSLLLSPISLSTAAPTQPPILIASIHCLKLNRYLITSRYKFCLIGIGLFWSILKLNVCVKYLKFSSCGISRSQFVILFITSHLLTKCSFCSSGYTKLLLGFCRNIKIHSISLTEKSNHIITA